MNKIQKIAITVFFLIIYFITFSIYNNTKKEFQSKYSFVITKIKYDSKGSLIACNEKEEINCANYQLLKSDFVYVGDRIEKDVCSDTIFIYRKNIQTEKYELYLKTKYRGIFPKSWFCNN